MSIRELIGAVLLAAATAAAAQSYPSRPIRLVVPVAPGGGPDVIARMLAPKLGESLAQSIVVENRAGANALIGADVVAKSPPDGYVLLMATAQNTVNPSLVAKMPHDIVNEFAPVALLVKVPYLLEVHPAVPAASVKELIAIAKASPGKLNFGSGGTGSAAHLAAELMNVMAGIKMVHVSYKGVGLAFSDLLGGHLDLMFPAIPSGLPYHRSGRLRGLGVTSPKRNPSIRELPTIAEAALPGFEMRSWFGVMAPASTPREIVSRLNAALRQLVASPQIHELLVAQGTEPESGTPEEFAGFVKAEVTRAGKVVRAAGVKPEGAR